VAYTAMHGAVGVALTKVIPNPWVALPLAVASHLLVDLFPEASCFPVKRRSVVLFVVEVTLAGLVVGMALHDGLDHGRWLSLAGFLAANLMDLMDAVLYLTLRRELWCSHPRGGWFPLPAAWWRAPALSVQATAVLDVTFVGLLTWLSRVV